MRKTNKKNNNGNGNKKYNPEIYYRHLGADVWEKMTPEVEKTDIAYSEEIEKKLKADDDSTEEGENNS